MSRSSGLTKSQILFILVNSLLCISITIASIIMVFNYEELQSKTVLGEDLLLSIWILVGWFILMYLCYAITSLLINCNWQKNDRQLTYEDVTLELQYINVKFLFFNNRKANFKK
jgi:hypothetical protein